LPGTVETGIHPVKRTLLQHAVAIENLLKSVTMSNCSQVKTLVTTASTQMSFPETVCPEIIRLCKPTISSAVLVAVLRRYVGEDYLATALEDFAAVSMAIARSLKT
jgi:hypothetical protein